MGIEDFISSIPVFFTIGFWLQFIRTFCADKKYQKALRMDAFLTPNEADDFWVLRNSFSYPRPACITNSQTVLTLFPKNIRALTVPFNGAGSF